MTPSRRITTGMCLSAHEFLREVAQGHSRSWQPVTAIYAEGDILIVWVVLSFLSCSRHICFAGPATRVTFKVLLCVLLCNLIVSLITAC
jgi:hypothetical protein